MSTLFVSHSSQDAGLARELESRLANQGHASVFLDIDPEKGLVAGQSWERSLYRKLRACSGVIAICTPAYLASHWCFAEIALARMEGKHIFAVKAPGLGNDARLPSILSESQYIDMRSDPEDAFRRLWRGLEQIDLLGVIGEWDPKDPPYLGLNAFLEKHAPVFFGREEETRAGVELLDRGAPGLIMALGPSGSGKSSLVRAGIVPRLRRLPDHWLIIEPLRPGSDPFQSLAGALIETYRRYAPDHAGRLGETRSLSERLCAWSRSTQGNSAQALSPDPSAFDERVERLLAQLAELHQKPPSGAQLSFLNFLDWSLEDLRRICQPRQEGRGSDLPLGNTPLIDLAFDLRRVSGRPAARVLLVIDQFEELIDSAGDQPRADHFAEFLRRTVEADGSPVTILGTMRSDFLGAFQRFPAFRGVDFENLSLGPVKQEGLRRIIEEPARLGAIALGNGLVDRLIADTETPDALPLLSFTLWILWRDYSDDGAIDLHEYEKLGGLQGAVSREADALLVDADATALREAFVCLARLNDDGQFIRQAVLWDSPVLQSVHPIIERFIDRRLLVSRTEQGVRTVEVAHEALLRSWEPLRRWLNENRTEIQLKQQVSRDARVWVEGGKDKDSLWRGARLAQAESLLQGSKLEGVDREFVVKGVTLKKRRRASLAAIAGAVFIGLTGLAVWALIAERQAVHAKQQLSDEYESMIQKILPLTTPVGAAPGTLTLVGTHLSQTERVKAGNDGPELAIIGKFGDGRVLAVAHDAYINSIQENLLFLELVIKWASPGEQTEKILYSVGHCEVVSHPSQFAETQLPIVNIEKWNYTTAPIQDLSDAATLATANLLIVGNAWATFTPGELDAVEAFVRSGGAVLMAGIEWSFAAFSGPESAFRPCTFNDFNRGREPADAASYPMNDLAGRFGIVFAPGAQE